MARKPPKPRPYRMRWDPNLNWCMICQAYFARGCPNTLAVVGEPHPTDERELVRYKEHYCRTCLTDKWRFKAPARIQLTHATEHDICINCPDYARCLTIELSKV